jgi:hypothetical protein
MELADLTLAERQDLALAFDDHATFCAESLSIRNRGGSVVPLILEPSQIKLHAAIERQRAKHRPVRLVVLKTRRSGFTTGSCAEMFHEVPFYPGRKGLIIADTYKPAGKEAFDYLLQFQRRYKAFRRHGAGIKLKPLIKDSQQEIAWANGSSIEVLSAEAGEIRGGGRHSTLCDEVAFWRDAALTLLGVLNMVPFLPETSVIIQSTANGIGGEFYEYCQRAQDPSNEGGYEFVFFGWLEHPLFVRHFDNVQAMVKFSQSLDKEERALHETHGATLEQLYWRRWKIATDLGNSVEAFHQEYPTTPEEAFLASGRPVFDHKAIMRMPSVGGQAGELEQLDDEGPIKRLVFKPNDRGALTIWKRPIDGRRYVGGGDPSKGIDVSVRKKGEDPDYSVGFFIDADTGEQVAMLRARIRPVAFAEYFALVGQWYNYAFLVPEANDAGFIDSLVRTRYPMASIYQRQRDPTDKRPATIEEIGFETTPLTRSWLIGAGEDAIRTQAITVVSPVAINELIRFVIKPNGKKEHQDGAHDDCVLALCFAEIGRRAIPKRIGKPGNENVGRAVVKYGVKRSRDEDDTDH